MSNPTIKRNLSITEQAEDNPTGRLLEGIIETVDEFYSENLAQDVLRGMREAASRGFWVAPMAPYGYRKVKVQDGPKERPTLEPDPETNRHRQAHLRPGRVPQGDAEDRPHPQRRGHRQP